MFRSDSKLELGFTLPFSHARGAFLITFPFGILPMTSFPLAISAPITTEYATTLRRSRADKHSHTLVAWFEWELCQFTSQTSRLKCYQRHTSAYWLGWLRTFSNIFSVLFSCNKQCLYESVVLLFPVSKLTPSENPARHICRASAISGSFLLICQNKREQNTPLFCFLSGHVAPISK